MTSCRHKSWIKGQIRQVEELVTRDSNKGIGEEGVAQERPLTGLPQERPRAMWVGARLDFVPSQQHP